MGRGKVAHFRLLLGHTVGFPALYATGSTCYIMKVVGGDGSLVLLPTGHLSVVSFEARRLPSTIRTLKTKFTCPSGEIGIHA